MPAADPTSAPNPHERAGETHACAVHHTAMHGRGRRSGRSRSLRTLGWLGDDGFGAARLARQPPMCNPVIVPRISDRVDCSRHAPPCGPRQRRRSPGAGSAARGWGARSAQACCQRVGVLSRTNRSNPILSCTPLDTPEGAGPLQARQPAKIRGTHAVRLVPAAGQVERLHAGSLPANRSPVRVDIRLRGRRQAAYGRSEQSRRPRSSGRRRRVRCGPRGLQACRVAAATVSRRTRGSPTARRSWSARSRRRRSARRR